MGCIGRVWYDLGTKHEGMVGYIYWHEIGMHDNITLVGET